MKVGKRIASRIRFWAMLNDDPDDLRGPFVSAYEAQAWIDEAPEISHLFKVVGTTTQINLVEKE